MLGEEIVNAVVGGVGVGVSEEDSYPDDGRSTIQFVIMLQARKVVISNIYPHQNIKI
jgi:hypothetical protein